MPQDDSPEIRREATVSYLERERDCWLDLRGRVERTKGLDAELVGRYNACNDYMNMLLEELFSQTVEVA